MLRETSGSAKSTTENHAGYVPIARARRQSSRRTKFELRAQQAKYEFQLPDGARRLVASGDFDGRENKSLVAWLSNSPDLSKRLLKWCNLPMFNRAKPFPSLAEASRVMDGRDLARLAVLVWLRSKFIPDVRFDIYSRDFLWSHSVAVGTVAALITRCCGVGDSSNAMVAGVMHDVGICASEHLDPESFAKVIEQADPVSPIHEIERDVQGWDHAELGGRLTEIWGMPDDIVFATRYHHQASEMMDSPHAPTLAAVVLANYLCTRSGRGSTGLGALEPPDPVVYETLSIDQNLMSVIVAQIGKTIEDANELR